MRLPRTGGQDRCECPRWFPT